MTFLATSLFTLCALFASRNIPTSTCRAVSRVGFGRRVLFHTSCSHLSSCAPSSTSTSDSFLYASNSDYVDAMYLQYQKDPTSVHSSWQTYFKSGKYTPRLTPEYGIKSMCKTVNQEAVSSCSNCPTMRKELNYKDEMTTMTQIVQMVQDFRTRGHLIAKLDPLQKAPLRATPQEFHWSNYGLKEADLDREFDLTSTNTNGFLNAGKKIKLRDLYNRLQAVYCGTTGYEYTHIPNPEQANFIRGKVETMVYTPLSKDEKLEVVDRLIWADHFERFLGIKYSNAKRFGLEGADAFIPALQMLLLKASDLGVEAVVLGMPHRGRLNVLHSILKKPLEAILSEFQHVKEDELIGTGDVKYHLGMSVDRLIGKHKKKLHVALLANPSHLEAVDPVVCGRVRAKQLHLGDKDRSRVMGVLVHGDAAFAGQGVVWETFMFDSLKNYNTGGTIHLVVNNQIGFTTDPSNSRSTTYCSDIAKAINAPIFHVNGDDPEAVARVCQLAAEWRQRFKQDVVVDMLCYRRYGHNEIDEPKFTQPLMYSRIEKHPTVLELYSRRLVEEGSMKQADINEISRRVKSFLESKFQLSKTYLYNKWEWLRNQWFAVKEWHSFVPHQATGIDLEMMKFLGDKLYTMPPGFTIHPRLGRDFDNKRKAIASGKNIDWATAEAFAYGSLCLEGFHVRLSGQDVERGTFSHRHAVLHDQKSLDGSCYTPLCNLSPKQAPFTVSNSSLSEYGVLGFELGYSMEHPFYTVIWEAQFGDFANGAQIIIDQFISCMEDKWQRQNGLVMLLPHGYEGQGPEHSSARIERYLELCNEHPYQMPDKNDMNAQIRDCNWQIVNCTSSANFFHALRRQMHRKFRKPLIVFTPKALLRHPLTLSTLDEMKTGTSFRCVLPDPLNLKPSEVKRVVFCSGKVYTDLHLFREKNKIRDVTIIRLEQLCPFPFFEVQQHFRQYPHADLVFCQEEPMNMGPYHYVTPRFETALGIRPKYCGRVPSSSPAVGNHDMHERELKAFLSDAFDVSPKKSSFASSVTASDSRSSNNNQMPAAPASS